MQQNEKNEKNEQKWKKWTHAIDQKKQQRVLHK